MNLRLLFLSLLFSLSAVAEIEKQIQMPFLNAGGQSYSNVTVTEVTATDLYFKHSKGFGNAKLRKLDPDLQKKFGFDPQKAGEIEEQNKRGNARLASTPPIAKTRENQATARPESVGAKPNVDIIVPELHAKSFLHQKAPAFVVEKWISQEPDLRGKFVLLDFWATWCGPCKRSIPHLNGLQSRFKDRLVVVGISDESEGDVRMMSKPVIEYSSAIDERKRLSEEFEVQAIPHSVLINPEGIVRFEGMPDYLNEKSLEKILKRYAE